MSSENTLFVDNILDRIKEKKGHKSDADLSRFLEISTAVLSNWRKRNTINYSVVLSKCYDWDMDWLLKGDMNTHDVDVSKSKEANVDPASIIRMSPANTTPVPIYDVIASAGHGAINDIFNQDPISFFHLPTEWIKSEIGNNVADLFIFKVYGDSMEPAMHDKDLLIARKNTEFSPSHSIYLFRRGENLFVKRIQRKHDGLLIISDNNHYQTDKIPAAEMDSFSLVARVVRVIRRP